MSFLSSQWSLHSDYATYKAVLSAFIKRSLVAMYSHIRTLALFLQKVIVLGADGEWGCVSIDDIYQPYWYFAMIR